VKENVVTVSRASTASKLLLALLLGIAAAAVAEDINPYPR